MEPILLVHGYSAESAHNDPADVVRIFGQLPDGLKRIFPAPPVLDVNISRYISLDDGVDLEDITLAFDRVLKNNFSQLHSDGFNAIIHSTGALVLRNWIRRCSPRPSPCRRIIHLAGANLGSGWAHLGETLLAKWLRYIGEGGSERGMAVLDGLELGSNWAWELHRYFLQHGNTMLADYHVMEFSIIGSQPPPKNMIVPFRYGKEDGSDGVLRVAASNLNHHYIRIGLAVAPENVDWDKAVEFSRRTVDASAAGDVADFSVPDDIFAGEYYTLLEENLPGEPPLNVTAAAAPRPVVPFAIPYCCAHSTEEMGIVSGRRPREKVLELIRNALTCPDEAAYAELVESFKQHTDETYGKVGGSDHVGGLQDLFEGARRLVTDFIASPEAQYDRHAQVSVRVRDQHGKPITDCSIHFNSFGGNTRPSPGVLINQLFEDTHQNKSSPDTTTFYLRLEAWNGTNWVDRLAQVNGVDLEIDCIDPKTERIVFVPMRMRLTGAMLSRYLKPHRATLIDVELLRLPARETFSMYAT
jgi:hypothetical protein